MVIFISNKQKMITAVMFSMVCGASMCKKDDSNQRRKGVAAKDANNKNTRNFVKTLSNVFQKGSQSVQRAGNVAVKGVQGAGNVVGASVGKTGNVVGNTVEGAGRITGNTIKRATGLVDNTVREVSSIPNKSNSIN